MRRGFAWAVLFLLVTAYPGPGAQAQTGVVLVHGKQGLPEGMQRLATQLVDAGYLVERPEMCWSRGRIYDKAYLDCLADIDLAVERLQERSAKHIVIAGMSLGGNAVLAYGARHGNLTGIVAFAPAHAPEFISRRPDVADSLTRAHAMIAAGRGDAPASFNDVNTKEDSFNFTVTTTAAIYVSFFASDSSAVMPGNAARLTAPLLLIAGTRDQTQRNARAIFDRVPSNPMNRFVSIKANHIDTPAVGAAAMISWLRELIGG